MKQPIYLRLVDIVLVLLILVLVTQSYSIYHYYFAPAGENYTEASNLDDFNKAWKITGYDCSSLEYTAGLYNKDYRNFPPNKYNVEALHALIGSANNCSEAKLATRYWLNLIKQNPDLLAGDAKIILNKDIEATTLSSSNGYYATDAAISLANEVWTKLSNSKSIVPATAPKESYELILIGDKLCISDPYWSLWSDLKSIKIVLDDDRTIWVLGGGGDIVVKDYIYNMPAYDTSNG